MTPMGRGPRIDTDTHRWGGPPWRLRFGVFLVDKRGGELRGANEMKFIVSILQWLVGLVFGFMDALENAIKLPPLHIELKPVGQTAPPLPEAVRQTVAALQAEGFVLAGT